VTATWRNLQRLRSDFHGFVDRTRPHVHREAVAVGGEGPSCDRLSGSHKRAGSHARAAPVEVAKALDLGKADIFERASELGRDIDAEPERDGAARAVDRGQDVLGSTSPAWSVRVG
jgi:hypothetical protein